MNKPVIIVSFAIVAVVSYFVFRSTPPSGATPSFSKSSRAQTESNSRTPQIRDWKSTQTRLQSQLELPQIEVPWDTIEPEIHALLEEDEPAALRLIAGLTGNVNHYVLRLFLNDYYAKRGDWSDGLKALEILQSNQTLSTPLVAEFLEAYAKDDPEAAESWLLAHSEMSGIESAALSQGSLAGKLADPAAAFTKMNKPEIPANLRASYLQGLMKGWARQDLDSALTYLSQADLAPELDPAIYNLIEVIKVYSPSSTMAWAEIIQSEGLRRSAIIEAARSWADSDPEAYEAWKSGKILPEDLKKEIP